MMLENSPRLDTRGLLEASCPRRVGEYVKTYLARAARTVGITPRMARAAWDRDIRNPYNETAVRLREAAKHVEVASISELAAIKQRIEILEKRLQATDPEFYREQVSGLSALRYSSG